MSEKISIKRLDIRDFTHGDAAKRKQFVDEVRRGFGEIGFLVIKGHDVTLDLQKRAYEQIDAFFKLPLEQKLKYEVKGIGGARGYTPFGREHAKNTNVGDLKEFFHVGVEVPDHHALKGAYPANVSVKEVPAFDKTLRELYQALLDLGMELLRATALALDLEENYFDEKVRYGNSILRPIHYPSLTGKEEKKAIRSSAHEDINLITLLIGASYPGLQVVTRQGEWLPITTEGTEIVVNVGDMLQRHTNYRLVSTTHRVVNPEVSTGDTTRFSIPFFLHPVSEMSLAALPGCVSPSNPAKDPPTTAGEYLHQRLVEIGLI